MEVDIIINGERIRIEVTETDAIIDWKRKIFEIEHISIIQQHLMLEGRELEDNEVIPFERLHEVEEKLELKVDEQVPMPEPVDETAAIDIDKLMYLCAKSIRWAKPALERDLILVIGRTGAGKSATINYLMGSRMEGTDIGLETCLDVAAGETEYVKIGYDGTRSQTLYCKVVPTREFPQDLAYADCPGFDETRSREVKLCSSMGIPLVISYARAVKGILVVIKIDDITSGKSENFSSLLQALGVLIQDIDKLISMQTSESHPILFVFTKVPARKSIRDIIQTIQKRQREFNQARERKGQEISQILQQLADELDMRRAFDQAPDDEARALIAQQMLERVTNTPNISEKARDYVQQYLSISAEIADLSAKSCILEIMRRNEEDLFIIRGDEHDDKPKILERIARLRASNPIPKDHLRLKGSNEEWRILDKVIQKIAIKGSQLLDIQRNYAWELASLKQYRQLLITQGARYQTILNDLRRSNISIQEITRYQEEICEMSQVVVAYLGKNSEERRREKEQLERELNELDTTESVRYKHPDLEPVDLTMDEKSRWLRFVGILPAALAAAVLLLPVGVIQNSRKLVAKLAGDMKTIRRLNWYMEPCLLLATDSKRHNFIYDDLPFIQATLRACILSISSTSTSPVEVPITFGDESEKGKLLYYAKHMVEDKEMGFFDVMISNDRIFLKSGQKLLVWIELFVEKRIHPDFKPRIEEIKRKLKYLNYLLSDYLQKDLESLVKTQEEEQRLLAVSLTPGQRKERLCDILQQRLTQQENRFKFLEECRFSLTSSYHEQRREFIRKRSQFDILQGLVSVLGATDFVKHFLQNYTEFMRESHPSSDSAIVSSLDVVWGRKQAPDRQPDYRVERAKVQGTALGAFFRPTDKTTGWHGKLGYNTLPPISSPPLTPESLVRRGCALEALFEKVGADFYAYLSDGIYLVPKMRLAELAIENEFTREHALTAGLLQKVNEDRVGPPVREGVYVMSKHIAVYRDLAELKQCVLGESLLSFEQCFERGKLPEEVVIEGRRVPIKGLMEILAIGRLLADTDVLGGSAKNIGYVIERHVSGKPLAVLAVKVDPGYAFNFLGAENLFYNSTNPAAVNNPLREDKRHLQYGNQVPPLRWGNLTERQQKQFLVALEIGLRRLKDRSLVMKLITRRTFERTPRGRALPNIETADPVRFDVEIFYDYLARQERVYAEELAASKKHEEIFQDLIQTVLFTHAMYALQFSQFQQINPWLWATELWQLIPLEETRYLFGLTTREDFRYHIGNCLFEAIAVQDQERRDAAVLRQLAVTTIENTPALQMAINTGIRAQDEDFELHLAGGAREMPTNVENYLELMGRNQTWGTGIEIEAMVLVLGRPIVVLTAGNRWDYIFGENQPGEPLFLNFVRGNHYEPLCAPERSDGRTILRVIQAYHQEHTTQRETQPVAESGMHMAPGL